jgi:alkylation response protein AidB-like acyl-CoA dehydrogenase
MFADSDYRDFRAEVRAFCDAEVAPLAAKADEDQVFPPANLESLHRKGWWKIQLPEEFGGLNYNTVKYSIIVEEVSRVCGSTGLTVAAHNSLGVGPIYNFGTPEQRKRYLTSASDKPELVAFGLTEPQAGSDAGGTKSVAVHSGDKYILNGTKSWITSSNLCKYAVVTARTDKSGGVKGISSFVLEKGMKGFTIGKKENKMGCRGSDTAFLHFDDVEVPVEYRLGNEGEGFKQFMITLDGGRISIAAMALGLAVGAFEIAAKHAATRRQFGTTIGEFQAIQWKLADMATRIEAARGLIYGSSVMKDKKQVFSTQSAMAKMYASEVCNFCTYEAISILGAEGYSQKSPVERMYRDMKLTEIGEGTSEIQRIVIARSILKSVQAEAQPR